MDLWDAPEGGQAGPGGQKRGLYAEVTAESAAEVERLIGAGSLDGLDFGAIEIAVRQQALRIMGQMVAQRLNADRSDGERSCLPCACGAEARFAGRRPKTFTTALGPLTLERAWFHCDHCSEGFAPRDRALGLDSSSLSPAARRMIALTAAHLSFADSSKLLQELAELSIEPKQVERSTEALGRDIAEDERQLVEPEPSEAHTLYLGLDGTGVPVRKAETRGRKGKQPDGSAKTREAKLAAAWGKQRRAELDDGRFDDLLAALQEHADSSDDARKTLAYFTNNRRKMQYPAFRAQGLCVSTGVLEGGCKSVVAKRLKNGGMHWTVAGANAIIALRSAILSNRFDDFWERRAAG